MITIVSKSLNCECFLFYFAIQGNGKCKEKSSTLNNFERSAVKHFFKLTKHKKNGQKLVTANLWLG